MIGPEMKYFKSRTLRNKVGIYRKNFPSIGSAILRLEKFVIETCNINMGITRLYVIITTFYTPHYLVIMAFLYPAAALLKSQSLTSFCIDTALQLMKNFLQKYALRSFGTRFIYSLLNEVNAI